MSRRPIRRCSVFARTGLGMSIVGLLMATALHAGPATVLHGERFELQYLPLLAPIPTASASPKLGAFSVQLMLDDGTAEGASGVNGAAAAQFFYFQQFAPVGQAFDLEEIEVLFLPGANMAVGNAIQLVVLSDSDADPTNGALVLATFDETVQTLDGSTFSVFPLGAPVSFSGGEYVLIGVVPRFIQSGVTPPTFPAAVDTTVSQNTSWTATWTGDPPPSPDLPSDNLMTQVNGNWMIRGFGNPTGPQSVPEIPTLDVFGWIFLILLLGAAGTVVLRRGQPHAR